ncbi:hypothetical protein Z969_10445 [Clostridium novyi A str. 4570]|uniref:Uncharacterized protein n=1 Tax=Clostridium novyi A str. 4570 TaxID=1444290 RepID=A0AA88ZLD0_CLONO|nr:hypothetical protein [Clostridium novyi]KGM99785.1 hypothetical protein Z969_10445 [Clostridium novyi A str. 4570]
MNVKLKIPVIIYKEGDTFTAEYVGLKNIEYGYSTLEELKKDFIKGIESGIEGLVEHNLSIPDTETIIKELRGELELQSFEMIQSIEFIEYTITA